MWDTVIIGKGNNGCSAVIVPSISERHGFSVSQNAVSYWVSNIYLGRGMTVFKDTPVGAKLTKLIAEGGGADKAQELLITAFLANVKAEDLRVAVDEAISRAFEAGSAAKAAEIRAALNL